MDDKSAAIATIWHVRTDVWLAEREPEVEAGSIHFSSIWLWVINNDGQRDTVVLQLQPAQIFSPEQEVRQSSQQRQVLT